VGDPWRCHCSFGCGVVRRHSGHQHPSRYASRRPCWIVGSLPSIRAWSSSAAKTGSRPIADATFWVVRPSRLTTLANFCPPVPPGEVVVVLETLASANLAPRLISCGYAPVTL